RAPLPPNNAALFAQQIRAGFVVLAGGSSRVDVRQRFPVGLEAPMVLVPAGAHLTVSAPGLRMQPDRADKLGNAVKVYELPDIAPGGTLALTVSGLPDINHTGRNVAATLCLLLIGACVVLGRSPADASRARAETDKLADR